MPSNDLFGHLRLLTGRMIGYEFLDDTDIGEGHDKSLQVSARSSARLPQL